MTEPVRIFNEQNSTAMSKRTTRKVNGGIAIYYGFTCAVAAIATAIGTGNWLYKVLTDEKIFSWSTLTGLIILTAVLAAMGYVILRVGYEEIED